MAMMTILLLLSAALALGNAKANGVAELHELQQVQKEEQQVQEEEQEVQEEEQQVQEEEQEVQEEEQEVQEEEQEVQEEVGVESRSLCPSGWTKYGSRCLMFVRGPSTWIEAERYCVHFGANLASVHNSQEYHFLQELVRSHTNGFPGTWIGGSDAVYNTIWLWSDGSRFDYHGWNPGEPSNNNRERCLEMNFGVHKRWNNKPCHYTLPSICSKRLC
ncbi:ladderlectin-like [Oncorhynchus clarkii lewisi]|uniref:ladderlectin-like n=1 Tax=Oncorhynchus clarkii lewisi TaxID=490388 RepID=UPI0039B97091